ncbi:MAG: CvpA family protein [Sedimentisphaerales bacterium]|jgi:hypothetical protein
MIAELIVIIVILATAVFAYLKGSVVKSSLLFINAIISSTIAFSFFETAGKIIIGYGYGGQWVLGGCFAAIFIFLIVLLNALTNKLAPAGIHFSELNDKIARSVIAVFAGLIIAGVILITAALLPLGTSWPYERFDPQNKKLRPAEPDKGLILRADGFTAALASWFSRGSLCSSKSFAVFHPNFLNEIFLNRIRQDENNWIIAGSEAVDVKDAWEPNSTTKLVSATDSQPLGAIPGTKTVIVRTGLKGGSITRGGAMTEDNKLTFTLAQIRLLCKADRSTLTGSSQVAYPVGFIRSENIVDCKSLIEEIRLKTSDFTGGVKWFDFVFQIPADTVPVLLEFKLNAAAEVGKLVSGSKIPSPL